MIKENLKTVEAHICAACERAGRDRSEVTLIAVSKTKPVEDLMEAYDAGIRVFGENKVQELVGKMDQMPKDIHWHMIGHLQKNKVKYIVGRVDLIHGVDNEELAEELGMPVEKIREILKIAQDPVSLETPIGEEEDSHLGDFIPDDGVSDPASQVDSALLKDADRAGETGSGTAVRAGGRENQNAGRGRVGVRGYPGAHPADRGKGHPEAEAPDTEKNPSGLPDRWMTAAELFEKLHMRVDT